jgi:transglutaminase-like putative cysteine protease
MRLHVGCEFQYDTAAPSPAIVVVEPRDDREHRVVTERWLVRPDAARSDYRDGFGNRVTRLTLPQGPSTLRYDAFVDVSGDPDPVVPDARQLPVEELPDDVLVYTLASRYCLTETLSQTAWNLFGQSQPGWARVQAVCDWINANVRYGGLHSTPRTTAVDVFVGAGGICRDFAHLAVTFCRCLNIPARYVVGYIPFEPEEAAAGRPMDFHAWFEAFLDGHWYTFDARFNRPRVGRIPIAWGRDAVDVAMVTTYGPALFRRMTVYSDEVAADATELPDAGPAAGASAPAPAEALVTGTTPEATETAAAGADAGEPVAAGDRTGTPAGAAGSGGAGG